MQHRSGRAGHVEPRGATQTAVIIPVAAAEVAAAEVAAANIGVISMWPLPRAS